MKNLTNELIDGGHALDVLQSFLDVNNGGDATTDLLFGVFDELFDCSADMLIENLKNRNS